MAQSVLNTATKRTVRRIVQRIKDVIQAASSKVAAGTAGRHSTPLDDVVAEARIRYHPSKATGFIPGSDLAPVSFVLSHKLRV